MSLRLPSALSLLSGAACLVGLSLLPACTDEAAPSESACDGAGHLHGDHCHCNVGFVVSADGLHCLPQGSDTDSDSDGEHDDHDHDHDHDSDTPDPGDEVSAVVLAFEPQSLSAHIGLAEDHTFFWLLEAHDGQGNRIRLEHYETFGAPLDLGTSAITLEDSSYATCASCLILETGCESHEGHTHCERTFMPLPQGQLSIEALGQEPDEDLALRWQDLLFQEVHIAQDYTTTALAEGQRIRLPHLFLQGQLLDFNAGSEECGGHGHLHGSTCHCDPGYHLDPNDAGMCLAD